MGQEHVGIPFLIAGIPMLLLGASDTVVRLIGLALTIFGIVWILLEIKVFAPEREVESAKSVNAPTIDYGWFRNESRVKVLIEDDDGKLLKEYVDEYETPPTEVHLHPSPAHDSLNKLERYYRLNFGERTLLELIGRNKGGVPSERVGKWIPEYHTEDFHDKSKYEIVTWEFEYTQNTFRYRCKENFKVGEVDWSRVEGSMKRYYWNKKKKEWVTLEDATQPKD